MIHQKFEQRAPSHQTVVDIFKDSWATNLRELCQVEGTGTVNLLTDPRIGMAAAALGKDGRFDDYRVLELGPLEGAHSYQLEQLGARSVVAIEANTEAFIKCLLLKEMVGLRTKYLCGDVISHLQASQDEFDLIFCCGILYHMADPVELIKQICLHSNRCFVWTHYYMPSHLSAGESRTPRPFEKNGFETVYYQRDYPSMADPLFLGGNQPLHSWMTRDEITRAFAFFGLTEATIHGDHTEHPTTANFSCSYARPV